MQWGRGLLLATLVACANDADDGSPRPASCDPATQRVGTYMVSYSEVSGTCGTLNSELVSLGPAAGGTPGCTLHSEAIGDGGCKIERTLTCQKRVQDNSQWGGYGVITNESTGVTYQRTQDGSRIEGTITMSLSDGAHSCRSTYSIVMVRQ